jgi:hypothetical protein
MEMIFEKLTRLCEAQVELQEAQLALCRDQYRAIRVNDVEYVEAKALDIETLNRRHAKCELARQEITARIVKHYGLAEECMALGILAELAPEPVRDRLQRSADRLAVLRQEMAEVVLNGTRSLQQAAEAIYRCMDAFKGCVQLVPEDAAAESVLQSGEKPVAAVS